MGRRTFLAVLLAAAAATAWATAFAKFPWEAPYNSDSAIVSLMANWDGWSPFHLYYFGQDRFGALPFLLMQGVHALTGLWWTPKLMTAVHIAVALATAFPVALLFKRRAAAAMATFIVLLLMGGADETFNVAQPYGWQLPLFFGAWVALRRMRATATCSAFVLALALAFAACWTSALSAPLLLACAVAEALAVPSASGARRRRLLLLAPVLLGGALEGVLRGGYQVYAKRNFGHSFRTEVHLQFSGAAEALWTIARDRSGPGLLLSVVAVAAGVYSLVFLMRGLRRRSAAADGTVTLAALSAAFVGHMLLLALGDHFRKNGLHSRYLVLAELLSWLCALQIVLMIVERWLDDAREAWLAAAMSAAVFASALWVPQRSADAHVSRFRAEADALAKAVPARTIIISGYWHVYAVAALAPPGHLMPVVAHGGYRRTPFLAEHVAAAGAWMADSESDTDVRMRADPPYTYAEKTVLELDPDSAPVTAGGVTWLRFRSTAERRVGVEDRRRCEDARFAPTVRPELFVVHTAAVTVKAFDTADGEVPLEKPRRNGDLSWFVPSSDAAVSRLQLSSADPVCPVEDVAVLRPAR